MDLVFGDTAAHQEKERLRHIEAQLRGVDVGGGDLEKGAGASVYGHDERV
jgi:hypothetical protein